MSAIGAAGTEVLIAGGGLVGLATALSLHHAGFTVAVVDQAGPPPAAAVAVDDGRVYALSPQSLRWLEGLGVVLPAVARGDYRRMCVWESRVETALTFEASAPQRPLGAIVEHRVLADALREATASLDIHWHAAITAAAAEEGAATLTLQSGEALRARLLIVSDGPRSPLRALLGVAVVQRDYGQRAIVATVQSEVAHQHCAWQRFLPTGPVALLPRADGLLALVWSADEAEAEALLQMDAIDFDRQLTAVSQRILGALTLVGTRKAIALQLLHPQQLAGPGFALAGDAAHVIHPLAGQGLNLGFADAEGLTTALKDARTAGRGWWRERTLAAYARARKAELREMMVVTDGLQRLFARDDAGIAALRRLGMGAVQRSGMVKHWLTAQATRA